jgi:enoyl-CoA hydratase
LLEALCGNGPLDAAIAAVARPVEQGAIAAQRQRIERLFAGDSVEAILARLDAEADDWARKTAAIIRTKSPLSLKIALAQVRRGRHLDFAACMRTEFRIVSRIIEGHDFYEGVRAVIVDKDNQPRWRPAGLAEVDAAQVEAHFAPRPGDELSLP